MGSGWILDDIHGKQSIKVVAMRRYTTSINSVKCPYCGRIVDKLMLRNKDEEFIYQNEWCTSCEHDFKVDAHVNFEGITVTTSYTMEQYFSWFKGKVK